MQDAPAVIPQVGDHVPWNKGKITGAKPPLRPKHVWTIRSKLQQRRSDSISSSRLDIIAVTSATRAWRMKRLIWTTLLIASPAH